MAPKELHLRLTWRDTRGTLLPVRRAASYHVFFFLADSRQCGSDLGRFTLNWVDLGHIGHIGRNRRNGRFRPKFQKKKCKTHCLNLITNPTSAHFIQTPNFSSFSLRHSSLTLSVLSASLSLLSVSPVAIKHSAT